MPKRIDLTGQVFGRLTVVRAAPNAVYKNKSAKARWVCACDCGKHTIVLSGSLIKGATTSCGCYLTERRRSQKRTRRDITGQVFNYLTALAECPPRQHLDKPGPRRWLCQCKCGNQKVIAMSELCSGKIKSCGCYRSSNKIDFTGKKFGRLSVLGPAPDKSYPGGQKARQWHCICRCGKHVTIQQGSLQQGLTKSCGCLAKERARKASTKLLEPNAKFGELTVIRRNGQTNGHKIKWLCRCSCGKYTTVIGKLLRNGHTKSCGCSRTKHKICAGDRYSRLTVLRIKRRDSRGRAIWECKCDCGATTLSTAWQLYSKNKQSCGCLIKDLVGPKHHNWDATLTDEHRNKSRLRVKTNQTTGLSKKVFQRDNFTCIHCGQYGTALAAHHIMPWAAYPTLRYAVENCITLCKDCHREFHSMYGKNDFDDEDLNEYLT